MKFFGWLFVLVLLAGCGAEWFPDDPSINSANENITTTQTLSATAKCCDGTFSDSKSCSGTCSNHGGVLEWLNASMGCNPPTACGTK